MKKSLSRILSVALVLAMLVSVVPFALAADTISVTPAESCLTLTDGVATTTVRADIPETPEGYNDPTVEWSGSADGTVVKTTNSTAVFTAEEAGQYTVFVNVVFTPDTTETPEEPLENIVYTGSCEITVIVSPVLVTEIKIDSENGENTVEVGKTLQLTAAVEPEDATNREVTWSSKDTDIATVSDTGLVTGVKAGTTVITATAKDGSDVKGTFAVTVTTGPVVTCKGASMALNDTVTLKPEVTGLAENEKVATVSYTYTTSDKNVTVLKNVLGNATVTGTSAGVATIHIKADYTLTNGTTGTAEGDVRVSVYSQPSLEVTLKDGVKSFAFDDTKVFSAVTYNGVKRTEWVDECMYDLLIIGIDEQFSILFTESSAVGTTSIGKLTPLFAEDMGLYDVTFTSTRSGEYTVSYTFYSVDDLKLAVGTLTIKVGGSAGDIVYETDYKTDVTFDEKDFQDFWNSNYTATNNTLKYVEFGVASTVPAYGELYTTTGKTKAVTSTMKFQPDYANSSSYYDLDAVTYEPSSRYTTAYTVEIPFTAYGGTSTANLTSLSGTVVIELNGASTDITSRGVVFGTGTKSIVDMMAADYAEAMKDKNVTLASVAFILPDVEDGRLYYDYDGILNSERVSANALYYVEPATGSKLNDLDKVAFIPAAGTTGRVTIQYIGYDKNGTNPYEGKVVFNVTAKTKSAIFTDVTATSYSWAADSIDFLYYEEVVNGTSSTKFGPASSITRGDFMIMLYRAFLEEDYGDFNVTSNFADVPKGTSAYEKETYQAVGVAKYLGIAKGDGTNFNPKSSITREEAMTLIYRTLDEVDLDLEYTSTKTTSSFSDYSKVSTYAQTSITYLIKHGIVIGSNGLINPKSNITRAEMAVILHRVLTY